MLDCDQLISEVFKRPAIWDKRLKEHMNRNVVDKSWKMISDVMEWEEDLLKKKWKYLRDQFTTELSKIKRPRSGDAAGGKVTSKWKYYNSLLFLRDVAAFRPSSGNLRPATSESCSSSASSLENKENDDHLTESNVGEIRGREALHELVPGNRKTPNRRDFEKEMLTPTGSGPTFTVNKPFGYRGKKNKLEEMSAHFLEVERRKVAYLENGDDNENLDEVDLFLRSCAPRIRRICPENLCDFQKRMLDLIQEFAYGQQYLGMATATTYECIPTSESTMY